jgi:hypothetical protein
VDVGLTPSYTLTGLTAGQRYYAVVTAISGDAAESEPSNQVSAVAAFEPVQVSLINPKSGAALNGPVTVSIDAAAASPDSTVAKVEFFADQQKIGESSSAPYAVVWPNVQPGQHTLVAKAWDTTGASASTSAIPINITALQAGSFQRRADGSIQFTVQAAAGSVNQVYASSDLTNWNLVDSFVNDTGTTVIIDPAAANVDRRFYRVQAQ